MLAYSARPKTIDAWFFDGSFETVPWDHGRGALSYAKDGSHYLVRTPDGTLRVDRGHYLIRDDKGKVSTCPPDVFATRYAPS